RTPRSRLLHGQPRTGFFAGSSSASIAAAQPALVVGRSRLLADAQAALAATRAGAQWSMPAGPQFVTQDDARRQKRAQRQQVPGDGVAETVVVNMDARQAGERRSACASGCIGIHEIGRDLIAGQMIGTRDRDDITRIPQILFRLVVAQEAAARLGE